MFRRMLILFIIVPALAACQTNDKATDPEAAQQLQPNITGYTTSSADSIVDAITAAGAGAALTTGNAPAAAAIAKAENIVQCLQDRGAVDARTYVETRPASIVPEAGVSLVINTTRVNENLLSCLTVGTSTFGAQAVAIEPCTGSGEFTYQGDKFTYLYVGVGDNLCGFFNTHFESIKANNQS